MAKNLEAEHCPQVPNEFQFISGRPTSRKNFNEGITPDLAYVSFHFQNRFDLPSNNSISSHPDFLPALRLLVDEWKDKDCFWWIPDPYQPKQRRTEFNPNTQPPDEVHLYSFGERKAIVLFPDGKAQPFPALNVLVDKNKLPDEVDGNLQLFETLLQKYLFHGYPTPEHTTLIEHGTFPQAVVDMIESNWPGKKEQFFRIQQNGHELLRPLGSFPTVGGSEEDFQLRLSITTGEKVLYSRSVPVAHIVTRYLEQNNKTQVINGTPLIPLPVFSQQELLIVGSTPVELHKNTRFMLSLLSKLTRSYQESKEVTYYEQAEAVLTAALLEIGRFS